MAANGVIIVLVEMVLIYKLEGKRRHMIYITLGVFMVGLSFLLLNIPGAPVAIAVSMICLLYTSDAADDLLCVDLGGRRIIKKKNNN